MAGETVVETPAGGDNKIEETLAVKTDKEAIVEEEAEAGLTAEEKKDEEKEEAKEKPAPPKEIEKKCSKNLKFSNLCSF